MDQGSAWGDPSEEPWHVRCWCLTRWVNGTISTMHSWYIVPLTHQMIVDMWYSSLMISTIDGIMVDITGTIVDDDDDLVYSWWWYLMIYDDIWCLMIIFDDDTWWERLIIV